MPSADLFVMESMEEHPRPNSAAQVRGLGGTANPGGRDTGGRRPRSRWLRAARGLAALAFAVSLISGGYLATAESWGTSSGGQVIVGGGTTSSTTWNDRPERNPDNERVMKVWAAVVVVLAFVGLVAAWSGPDWLPVLPAALLSVLSILGMLSIGLFVAPVAVLSVSSALCSLAGGSESRRSDQAG